MWDRIEGYRILGTTIRIQAQQRDFGQQFASLWDLFSVSSTTARSLDTFAVAEDDGGGLVLYHDCVRVAAPNQVSDAVRVACAEINRHVIGRYRGLGFHAGAVASGSAVAVFPGASGKGKTTLVAALTSVGFRYVSDEALCLAAGTLDVTPYPKPLAVGPWLAERLAVGTVQGSEAIIEPTRFLPVDLDEQLEVAHVVSFSRRPGPPRLVSLPRSTAVTVLLDNSFNHYKDPAGTFHLVTQLARRSESWLLEYEDAFQAAEMLAGRLV